MTITLGYVPTPEGEAAVDAAVEEARRRDTSVVVVHVGGASPGGTEPYSSEQQLDAVRARITDAGVDVEVREVPAGADIASTVMQVAEDTGSELIVIGIRRRSPVGKLILGSTAQDILLGAAVPVQAVKPPL